MPHAKHAKAAVLATCAATVATIGMSVPGPAVGEADRNSQGRPTGAVVIVPRGPGESVRVFSGQSRVVHGVARRSARSELANAADKRFVRHMIPHHYQAILMSRLAQERFGDERVGAIADRIGTEQNVEIDAMQGWQGREELPVTNAKRSYRRMLQDPEMLEHMGMSTRQEMRNLRTRQGRSFDRRFIKLMITHHEGAISMAEEVAGSGNDVFVRQLAIDLISAQSRQIHDMRQIRESW